MTKIRIAYDDNLGMSQDFKIALPADYIPYHDLEKLIEDFHEEKITAAFIPAGTLPYINSAFDIIGQATFGMERKKTLQTNFCVTAPIALNTIPSKTLGRVNQYCTTSYWGPLIYLMNHLQPGTPLYFVDTDGFQDMLFKLAAKQFDAAMVWDIILTQNPTAAVKVTSEFQQPGLPTPLLIAQPHMLEEHAKRITQFTSNDSHAFFNGFVRPEYAAIRQFQTAMRRALLHFSKEPMEA